MLSDAGTRDALLESLEIQGAASREGFDWPAVAGVLDKVEEEIAEIREALAAGDVAHARRELGDLLLVAVNLGRFLGADPAAELRSATRRFANRFDHLKTALAADGKSIADCTLDELEDCWQRIKTSADDQLGRGA